MSGEESGDKTHEPTQKKLDDARQRGDVPQSADLTTAAAYGGFLLAATSLGGAALLGLGASLSTLLAEADTLSAAMFAGDAQPLMGGALAETVAAVWAWFALPAALALLAVIAQGALVVAPERLVPKASRVSPLAIAQQKFGPQGLMEWAKGLLKLGIYGVLLGRTLFEVTPRLLQTAAEAPGIAVTVMLEILVSLLGQVFLVALVLGLADLGWQRLRHRKTQMMSRQEVTDEMKDSEGDPHMKHQRRQRGMSIAMNRMLADVPEASVVIVNPTHYAVALRWDAAGGRAPTCVAKGVDEIAARIREAAAEAGVPIRSDPPTARALYANTAIGAEVARDDWRAVAAAIRFAEAMRRRARPRSRP